MITIMDGLITSHGIRCQLRFPGGESLVESEAESSESSVEEEPCGRWFPLGGPRNLGHLRALRAIWAMGILWGF